MKISGLDYQIQQNYRIQNELISGKSDNVTPISSISQSDNNDGTVLQLSGAASRGSTDNEERHTAKEGFAPTEFTTIDTTDSVNKKAAAPSGTDNNSESVLSKYRFFVQSTQYEDEDGIVRRFFK